MAEEQKQDKADVENLKSYLEFSLGNELYAIPLLKVREVIAKPKTTPVPFTPKHFLGIMNLRGQVISIVDLKHKLKIVNKSKTKETAVIIVDLDSVYLGIVVDSVNSVLNITINDVNKPPQMESAMNSNYIEGVYRKKEKLVMLLDIIQVLGLEDQKTIKQSNPVVF